MYTNSYPEQPKSFEHLVQFYRNEDALMDLLANYFGLGIENGDSFIVIATSEHLAAIKDRLENLMDVDRAIATRKYLPLNAQETMSKFMVNGLPDAKKFHNLVGDILDRAALRGRKVRAFGEMVALLWQEGNTKGALKLEKLWNRIAESRDFSLLCSYPITNFHSPDDTMSFPQICTLHSHVVMPEKLTV